MKLIRLFYLLSAIIPLVAGCQNKTDSGFLQDDRGNCAAEHIEKNRGKVLVEVPEVFELANIAIAVSERGLKDSYRVRKQGAYYQRVLEHFGAFKDHRLIAQPDLNRNFGYFFRDNSICHVFEGDKLVHGGLYPDMRNPNLFAKNLDLVEDFARVSDFRKFYRENFSYYQAQIRRYRELVPIREMWRWLEDRFESKHDCYMVVFSPLLGSSHETCGFKKEGFSQTIMFISGPGESNEYTDSLGRALLARVVFTEIDHNYVNAVTARHSRRVNEVFADLAKWKQQDGYPSAEMTFNEYLTWALFILYAYDNYDENTFEAVKNRVVEQMVYSRRFIRFGEFANQLLKVYRQRASNKSIPDLYPAILEWAEEVVPPGGSGNLSGGEKS